jgi:hypothetical protein
MKMEPIQFPLVTTVWAKEQPQYRLLPAYVNAEETVTCWQLTWRERWRVLWTGRLWFRQMNFGQRLQPQLPSVENPFELGFVKDRCAFCGGRQGGVPGNENLINGQPACDYCHAQLPNHRSPAC